MASVPEPSTKMPKTRRYLVAGRVGWENAISPVTAVGVTADRSTSWYISSVLSLVSCAVNCRPVTSALMSRRVGSNEPHDVTSDTSVLRDQVAPSSLLHQPRSVYPAGSAARSAPAPLVSVAGSEALMSPTKMDPA